MEIENNFDVPVYRGVALCFFLATWLIDVVVFQILLINNFPVGIAHVCSFFITAFIAYLYFLNFFTKVFDQSVALKWYVVIFVLLLGFFVRGGILAFFLLTLKWPENFAIFPAALVTIAISHLGYFFLLWRQGKKTTFV